MLAVGAAWVGGVAAWVMCVHLALHACDDPRGSRFAANGLHDLPAGAVTTRVEMFTVFAEFHKKKEANK